MPSNSVVVGLRIRPLNSIERAENSRAVFRVRGDNTVVETVALSTYKYGINFGKGNAANAVGVSTMVNSGC